MYMNKSRAMCGKLQVLNLPVLELIYFSDGHGSVHWQSQDRVRAQAKQWSGWGSSLFIIGG